MENHLSFKEIIEPLLDCRKKTYSQDWFIRDLFSAYFMQRTYMVDEAEDNTSSTAISYKRGERAIQAIIVPVRYETVEITDELSDTSRGQGGFGSTGK